MGDGERKGVILVRKNLKRAGDRESRQKRMVNILRRYDICHGYPKHRVT
jgi:hypothetical protein